jgi:hypothetical protein
VLPQGYRLQIARPPITKVGEISLPSASVRIERNRCAVAARG